MSGACQWDIDRENGHQKGGSDAVAAVALLLPLESSSLFLADFVVVVVVAEGSIPSSYSGRGSIVGDDVSLSFSLSSLSSLSPC